MKYLGPVHFQYALGAAPCSELEGAARVLLAQLKSTMRPGVRTAYKTRVFRDSIIIVGYVNGRPAAYINRADGVRYEEEDIISLYVESGILDVITFLEASSYADTAAELLEAPVATTYSPTGRILFKLPSESFFFSAAESGASKVTPLGIEDKLRRSTPSSIYSGKMRLFVQSLYGSMRTDFDGRSGVAVFLRGDMLSPFLSTGNILVTTEDYRYWLLTVGNTITARRLLIGPVGQLVRGRLKAGLMDKIAAESYILADSIISPDSIEIGSIDLVGEPVAYGWHSTFDGMVSKSVVVIGNGFSSGFSSYVYTIDVSFSSSGIPVATYSRSTHSSAISVADSLVIPVGEYLNRVLDITGNSTYTAPVYGFYSKNDVWIQVNYTGSNPRGFWTSTVDARVLETSDTSMSSYYSHSPAFDEHNILSGASLVGVAHTVPGSGGASDLPEGYVFGDFFWTHDYFDDYRLRTVGSGVYSNEGRSILVIPHKDCTAVYLLEITRTSVSNFTGDSGHAYAYSHRITWPQLSKTTPPPTHPISNGNPPAPEEDAYRAEQFYTGLVDWRPGNEVRFAHGYFVTNGNFFIGGTKVTYCGANDLNNVLANIDESYVSSGSFVEATQIGDIIGGFVYNTVTPTTDILTYITGFDFAPDNKLSIGSWSVVTNLDLINTTADAVVLSFESSGGVSIFARQPNGVAYRVTSGDTPPYFALAGHI